MTKQGLARSHSKPLSNPFWTTDSDYPYEAATRSPQPGNLLKHVLTACALAKADENGYFSPVAVKEPLSQILGRQIDIANFQNHLKAFIDPKRKQVLQRDGEPRAYRFRFRQPAMQPFVLMKGIAGA